MSDDGGRVYAHEGCGGLTRVSGNDFTHICDPFWPCTGTFCCGCGKHVPFRECVWTETGEDLQSYTDKLRAARPDLKPKGCLAALVFVGFGLAGAVTAVLMGSGCSASTCSHFRSSFSANDTKVASGPAQFVGWPYRQGPANYHRHLYPRRKA